MTRQSAAHNHPRIPITLIPTPQPEKLPLNFVISDCPSDDRLQMYIDAFRKYHVCHLVRICDSESYSKEKFELQSAKNDAQPSDVPSEVGVIKVHDEIKFEDGGVPSNDLVGTWLDLVADVIESNQKTHKQTGAKTPETKLASSSASSKSIDTSTLPAIALHCVSGLGRAPILAAIAILEYCSNMECLDLVDYLRNYRRGVLNNTQLHWLEEVFWKKLRRKDWKRRHQRLRLASGESGLEISEEKKGFLKKIKAIFSGH